jgi:hypothetical protein
MTVVRRTKTEMRAMEKGTQEEFLTIEDRIARAREWLHFEAARLLRACEEVSTASRTTLVKHTTDVGTDPIYAMTNCDRAMAAAVMIDYHEGSGIGHRRAMIRRDLQIALDNPQDPRATIAVANGIRSMYVETVSYANSALSGTNSSSGSTREMSRKKNAYALGLISSLGSLSAAREAADDYLCLFIDRAVG